MKLNKFLLLLSAGLLLVSQCKPDTISPKAIKRASWKWMAKPGKKNIKFHPVNILDGKKNTAWCSDDEFGEFDITFNEEVEVNRLRIRNGWQKDKKKFNASRKVKKLRIGEKRVNFTSENINLKKGKPNKKQTFKLQNSLKGKKFQIEILDTYGGKGSDTCISSLELGVGSHWYRVKDLKEFQRKEKSRLYERLRKVKDKVDKMNKSGFVLTIRGEKSKKVPVYTFCKIDKEVRMSMCEDGGPECTDFISSKWQLDNYILKWDDKSLDMSQLVMADHTKRYYLENEHGCFFDKIKPRIGSF